jgi:hypothetical protein
VSDRKKERCAEPRRLKAEARRSATCDDEDRRDHHRDDHRPAGDCLDEDDRRPTRIVERTWYFDDDDRCRGGDGDGKHKGGHRGGRPSRPEGTDNGRLGDGTPLNKGDLADPPPRGVWVGPRVDMDLPYLFMRANPADLGQRPIVSAPFWESPDILIVAGVTPSLAPAVPAALGAVGLAGKPNTLYAHVWNFGKAAANEVLVEFYWCDPSLGITASTVRMIAQTTVALGARGSGHNHAVVKCPEAWTPTFVNGGHECLLVRVWDNPADLPGEPRFDAASNRHVAQRNIHVVGASSPKMMMMKVKKAGAGTPALAPALAQPVVIAVGALYGQAAEVKVERAAPSAMPWLQLHTGKRGVFPAMAPPTGAPALTPPCASGAGLATAASAPSHTVEGDDQQVAFSTTDQAPGPGEAHVYRVSASQGGVVFGGYTVVVLG